MGASAAISELESVHKIEYLASDLNTPSVTLFPSRAQVYREIKGLQLKRGTNEVTIVGLSQTVDSDSIKVESIGSATITNLEVEAVTNRQLFHEVYPESDSESESDSDEEEFSEDEAKAESHELKSAKDSLQESRDALAAARDSAGNAQKRLNLLEAIGINNNQKNGDSIQATLEQYKDERKKAFQDLTDSNNLQRSLSKDVEKAEKKYNKLQREEDKKNAKENKAKAQAKKEREKKKALKDRLKGEAKRERQRLRDEQQQFWPLEVYSVRITLEVAAFTPMTSRRGSTSSDVDAVKVSVAEAEDDEDAGPIEVDLAFSYVTSAAYWTPAYDLQLSTTNASATLYFDAMLTNQTSESWKSCKVTLSTSQATFSGLYDTIPTLVPWRIKLAKSSQFLGNQPDITRSNEETTHSNNRNNNHMHGPMVLHQQNRNRKMMVKKVAVPSSMVQPAAAPRAFFGSAPGGAPSLPPPPPAPMVASAAFGGSVNPYAQQQMQAQQQQMQQRNGMAALQSEGVLNDFDFDSFLNTDGQEPLGFDSFEASLVEETGLTTTYDLPGLKTLVPKFNGSKQRVARIPFSNVVFSHTVVAKYKPMAYLKAKLKNSSKMALLKGSASLTLDGTFMGKTSLPRCSSGESFSLSLGVDPAIKVTYPKPDVRRASVGLFTKEDSAVYVRTVELRNTRAVGGRAVNLLVLDQVPVSEDERLRVELAYPRGLAIDGANGVAVGEPGKMSKDENWGKASAKLKKDGQVTWDVSLNAGKTVKLSLEYAVSMPSGETAYQV
ncbi:uncharacterized protein Triagg1_7884 [Trichoderma aggressivum f. europaeum]|uniref:Mucoidy inhibitor-like protein n=1 Tax=Trichoderma aggressivum f. europaeum TaxID=173218 RepID=A0AAE1M2G3_9HYPO|nr:hypothetical protein Triagg1_7884 [Trichoderma aggressivum f. europaeum]